MVNTAPRRRLRRRWKVASALAFLVVASIAALPWALSTPTARRRLVARANRALAPGGVRCEEIRLSWFGPTRLAGVALVDPQGDPVIAAARATWDRNLFRILFDRDSPGMLTLEGATLDIERRADGSLDLVDALRPIVVPNPKRDFRLRIAAGRLRFRSPGLDGPLTGERANLDLHVPSRFRPVTWRLGLADRTGHGPTLEITGQAGRGRDEAGNPPDLEVSASGRGWPLAVVVGGVGARGRFQGKVEARRRAGRWAHVGDAQLLDFEAAGPALAGDRLRLDRVGGTWQVSQAAAGWAVDRLDLRSTLATLKASGRVPAGEGGPSRIEGEVDLAALAGQLPRALHLKEGLTIDRGSARLRVGATEAAGGTTWDVSALVSDIQAHDGARAIAWREPATLTARVVGRAREVRVEAFGIKTAFLDVSGRGDVDRGIAVAGTVDLGGLRGQARDVIDLGAIECDGTGAVAADYRRAGPDYRGHATLDLRGLRLAGLLPGTIRREALHLEAGVAGPADASGLPSGWGVADLAARDGGLAGELKATRGEVVGLTGGVRVPVRLAGREGLIEGNWLARWRGEAVELDDVRASFGPGDPGAEPIALVARGRFDRASGELTLGPVPGAKAGAIALAEGGIRASGLGRSRGAIRADLALGGDLAALRQALGPWTGALPSGLAGPWELHATARGGDDGLRLGGRVEAPDVSWGRGVMTPLSLAWQASRPPDADRLDVTELVLAGGYATLELAGRVEELGGNRRADLRGTLTPDWDRINALLVERVEPGAVARGKARPAHLKGPLAGGSAGEIARGLDAEAGIDLDGAECFGMQLGPTAVVARTGEKGLLIDPIEATLNGGKLRLEPEVVRDGSGGLVLRLGTGSTIRDAEINDEVSRRVLAYVAPVLDATTRARGKVSVDLTRAEFPIGGDAARRAAVEGHVVFRDAEFAPGPLAADLIRLAGRDETATLKLDEPVELSIADGRVHQRGMALPVGRLTRIELDGSVGFDRTLDLRAALPITPKMLGNNPLLGEVAAGARVVVPIGGTLSKPKIDREAFNLAVKDLGKDLLRRGMGAGAAELLMRLARPREANPAAPPRPTPEERRALRERRKAERQERKAERRLERLP